MCFSEKLVRLRKSRGLTQENLAERLGVSRQAVARWEAGETTPELKTLIGICEVFGVSADYLIHDGYDSDEDIPVVREKSEEIQAGLEKERRTHLIAAICFAVAAFCTIIGIVLSRHPAQLALSCFSVSLYTCLYVFHFYCYFKKK